jgi:hypothetical protein
MHQGSLLLPWTQSPTCSSCWTRKFTFLYFPIFYSWLFFFFFLMLSDFLFSDDDKSRKDAATGPPFGFLAAPEEQPQKEATVVKPSPVPPKKKATAPSSKRLKRGAAVTASLEVHQPSCSSDNVSSASYTRFFLSLILRFLYDLYPTGFDAEVSFS